MKKGGCLNTWRFWPDVPGPVWKKKTIEIILRCNHRLAVKPNSSLFVPLWAWRPFITFCNTLCFPLVTNRQWILDTVLIAHIKFNEATFRSHRDLRQALSGKQWVTSPGALPAPQRSSHSALLYLKSVWNTKENAKWYPGIIQRSSVSECNTSAGCSKWLRAIPHRWLLNLMCQTCSERASSVCCYCMSPNQIYEGGTQPSQRLRLQNRD